jgi:arsenate reductase
MSVEIWHNPRCSKSRQTLALIQDQGVEPKLRLYLKDTPSETELRDVIDALGIPAFDLIRRSEQVYREANLSKDDPDDKLIAAMVQFPKLIERPVVRVGDKAVLGRPPENVLDIL